MQEFVTAGDPFRVLAPDGTLADPQAWTADHVRQQYRWMRLTRRLDSEAFALQRHGEEQAEREVRWLTELIDAERQLRPGTAAHRGPLTDPGHPAYAPRTAASTTTPATTTPSRTTPEK